MSTTRQHIYGEGTALSYFHKNNGKRVLPRDSQTHILQFNNGSTVPSAGQLFTINISKFDDWLLENLTLAITVSATSGGSAGTYRALANAFPIFLFDYIELVDGCTKILTAKPHEIYNRVIEYSDVDEYPLIKQNLGIDTRANRHALAAASQTFYLDMSNVFNWFMDVLPIHKINNELQLRFKVIESLAYLLETDYTGSPTFSLTSWEMTAKYTRASQSVINTINSQEQLPYYDIEQVEFQIDVPNGATTASYVANDLRDRDVVSMNIVLVPTASLTTGKQTDYKALSSYNLKYNNNWISGPNFDITDEYYHRVLVLDYDNVNKQEMAEGGDGEYIYQISYADSLGGIIGDSTKVIEYTGSKNFSGITAPKFTFNFPSSLSGAHTLFVYASCVKKFFIQNGRIAFQVVG